MSVVTRMDELRESVGQKLKEVYKEILEMLNSDTWGHNEYSSGYIDRLSEIMITIKDLRKKI